MPRTWLSPFVIVRTTKESVRRLVSVSLVRLVNGISIWRSSFGFTISPFSSKSLGEGEKDGEGEGKVENEGENEGRNEEEPQRDVMRAKRCLYCQGTGRRISEEEQIKESKAD